MAKINRIPKFRSVTGCGIGIGAHSIIASVNASIGVAKNRKGDDVDGRTGSLINSFTPSAIGCNRP